MDAIQAHYQNKDNCLREMSEARKLWGLKSTTVEQLEQIIKALGLMYLYCPSELETVVLFHIETATTRQFYKSLLDTN